MHLPQIATLFTTAIAIALATSACPPTDKPHVPIAEMANPASVNCINAGGKLIIKRSPQGEFGMCQLPSGKVCEEWALFRGECA